MYLSTSSVVCAFCCSTCARVTRIEGEVKCESRSISPVITISLKTVSFWPAGSPLSFSFCSFRLSLLLDLPVCTCSSAACANCSPACSPFAPDTRIPSELLSACVEDFCGKTVSVVRHLELPRLMRRKAGQSVPEGTASWSDPFDFYW